MRGWILAAATAAALALGGCSARQQAQVNERVGGLREEIGRAAERARSAAEDAALAGKVKAALETRKGLEKAQIQVHARQGTVVLEGDVASREQAELAEQVALGTEGVTAVENRLTVRVPARALPPSGMPPGAVPQPPAGGQPLR